MNPQNNFIHRTAEVSNKAKLGNNVKIWHNSQILEGAEVGDDCVIGHNCTIFSRAKLGKGVKVQANTDVWDLVELGDYVFVGPSVVFTNDKNPRSRFPRTDEEKKKNKERWLPTIIREGAAIGANATIVCGVTIGKWAMIGAGALVTKDVPDYALFVSKNSVAEQIGWTCECGDVLVFNGVEAACDNCGMKYKKNGDKVSRS